MESNSIPQKVLFDELRRVIGPRTVRTAVFFTFQFDPEFFETEILPVLFDQSLSHAAPVRLLQLEEALRQLEGMAVYYDSRALSPDAKPARLDYARIGLTRATGYFHPKNVFLLVREAETERDSLIVATLSANLTRAGWWENVEAAHIEEIAQDALSTLRDDLMSLLNRIKVEDRMGSDHAVLETIHKFVREKTVTAGKRTRLGRWQPHLYRGQESIPRFLSGFDLEGYNLEIISPYFDDTDEAATLTALVNELSPRATRVFLPVGRDGAALCRQGFFERVADLHRVQWGRLPAAVVRFAQQDKTLPTERFVHAKVYRFWNGEREIVFVGSANLTGAAHQSARGGNFETGILTEVETAHKPTWWLEALETRPAVFRVQATEETNPDPFVPNVALEFDWSTKTLRYFWESNDHFLPAEAEVSSQGVEQFRIAPVLKDRWHELETQAAEQMQTLLNSTSLVEIRCDGHEPFRVLVREQGMAHKPSLLMSLTAEDILEYWSLLTPEQREAFISERLPSLDLANNLTVLLPKAEPVNSMFDRFAGIFYAFGQLERHVRRALDAGRESEAIYRLLGEKYDSLPALIERVRGDKEGDRVNRYVTLLSAASTLRHIGRDYPDFRRDHHAEFQRVEQSLQYLETLRDQFEFGDAAERHRFFDWFESMFGRDMSRMVSEEPK